MSGPRVLIVRLSAIGDVVHTLPALAALRRTLPDAHIAWLVESLSAPLLEGNPLLDELIVYPRSQWRKQGYCRSFVGGDMWRFFRELQRRRFDVAIDFQGLTKSALIPWLSGIPTRIGFGGVDGRELSQWLYTVRPAPPDELRHVIHRNLYLLTALSRTGCQPVSPQSPPADEAMTGYQPVPLEFPFPDLSAESERVARLLENQGFQADEKMAFLNPGAGWETKRWPPEYFGRLAAMIVRELGCRVLLTWGPGEEPLVETALHEVPTDLRAGVQRAPATTLREFVALLDRCLVMVGGDTGPVHLAAARGVPVVAVYGGSDAQRNGPLGPGRVRVLTDPNVECLPCWKVRCDAPPPRCMTSVTPDMVFRAIKKTPNAELKSNNEV